MTGYCDGCGNTLCVCSSNERGAAERLARRAFDTVVAREEFVDALARHHAATIGELSEADALVALLDEAPS